MYSADARFKRGKIAIRSGIQSDRTTSTCKKLERDAVTSEKEGRMAGIIQAALMLRSNKRILG